MGGSSALLQHVARAARNPMHPRTRYLSDPIEWKPQGADEWRLGTGNNHDAQYVTNARLNIDGRGHLFCGGAVRVDNFRNIHPPRDLRIIFESEIAGNVTAFLSIMAAFYRASGYHGHVDVGFAVTGLRAGRSESLLDLHYSHLDEREGYGADTYTRTARVAAVELDRPEEVAKGLLRHLFEATIGTNRFDPFSTA